MTPLRVLQEQGAESGGGCGSCGSGGGDARCGNGLEKVYQTTAVRYGYMKHVGEFQYADGMKFSCGARVVVQTGRGIEMGELVSLSCTGCDKHLSREQIKAYIEQSGPDSYVLESGRILREATVDDLMEEAHLRKQTSEMRVFAQKRSAQLNLTMRIIECEYLLGGDRVVFYFTADGRVDFRALVKDLSREYQTRVKMHQVGARDEARLLADYETCGREICCKSFLKNLKPVTMRMAKLQRSTLDPTKVSGRCGRLKCCLRYEHESYESLDKKLPRVGEKIKTAEGYGTVIDRQVLTQLVQIAAIGKGKPVTVVIEDVLERKLSEFPADAASFVAEGRAATGAATSGVVGGAGGPESAPKGGRRGRQGSGRDRKDVVSTEQVGGGEGPPAEASASKGSSESTGQRPMRRRGRRRGNSGEKAVGGGATQGDQASKPRKRRRRGGRSTRQKRGGDANGPGNT